MKYTYPMILHSEDGEFWAEFPDMAGCFTDGKTEAELRTNATEAMSLYLGDKIADGKPLPTASEIGNIKTEAGSFVVYVSCTLKDSHRAKHMLSDAYMLQEA